MIFDCPHCNHRSENWIKSGDRYVCPKCYRFVPASECVVQDANLDEMFGGVFKDIFKKGKKP